MVFHKCKHALHFKLFFFLKENKKGLIQQIQIPNLHFIIKVPRIFKEKVTDFWEMKSFRILLNFIWISSTNFLRRNNNIILSSIIPDACQLVLYIVYFKDHFPKGLETNNYLFFFFNLSAFKVNQSWGFRGKSRLKTYLKAYS